MLKAGRPSFLRETYRHLIAAGELLLVSFTHTHAHTDTHRIEGTLRSEREGGTVSVVKTGIEVCQKQAEGCYILFSDIPLRDDSTGCPLPPGQNPVRLSLQPLPMPPRLAC